MNTTQSSSGRRGWPDRLATVIERALDFVIGGMLLVMCAVTAWQIFSRYVLKDMSSWSEEVARFLMVWISLLGSAAVLRSGGHVTVTILIDRLSEQVRKIVLIVRDLILLVALLTITQAGWDFAELNAVQASAAMDIPMSWVYASLWIGLGLMALMLILARLGGNPDWSQRSSDEHP